MLIYSRAFSIHIYFYISYEYTSRIHVLSRSLFAHLTVIEAEYRVPRIIMRVALFHFLLKKLRETHFPRARVCTVVNCAFTCD